jgi:hypothetical protein
MAEPIAAIAVACVAATEILGEVFLHRRKSRIETQQSLEASVIPAVLDRIQREENNIKQVIAGKRKENAVIEEYPIELLEPHVTTLKQLARFSHLGRRLETQIDRNKNLPAGQKQFTELQSILDEIKTVASRQPSGRGHAWLTWVYSVLTITAGVCAVINLHPPSDHGQVESNVPAANDRKSTN